MAVTVAALLWQSIVKMAMFTRQYELVAKDAAINRRAEEQVRAKLQANANADQQTRRTSAKEKPPPNT